MRSFIIEDEYDVDSNDEIAVMKLEIKKEMINKLASEWNSLNKQMECRQYREMSDDYSDRADAFVEVNEDQVNDKAWYEYDQALKAGKTEEEAKAIKAETAEKLWAELEHERRVEENKPYIRMEVIEDLLAQLGARMMRPYEHWNEDERYMEYMENRYSYDYNEY